MLFRLKSFHLLGWTAGVAAGYFGFKYLYYTPRLQPDQTVLHIDSYAPPANDQNILDQTSKQNQINKQKQSLASNQIKTGTEWKANREGKSSKKGQQNKIVQTSKQINTQSTSK